MFSQAVQSCVKYNERLGEIKRSRPPVYFNCNTGAVEICSGVDGTNGADDSLLGELRTGEEQKIRDLIIAKTAKPSLSAYEHFSEEFTKMYYEHSNVPLLPVVIKSTWDNLGPEERLPYEQLGSGHQERRDALTRLRAGNYFRSVIDQLESQDPVKPEPFFSAASGHPLAARADPPPSQAPKKTGRRGRPPKKKKKLESDDSQPVDYYNDDNARALDTGGMAAADGGGPDLSVVFPGEVLDEDLAAMDEEQQALCEAENRKLRQSRPRNEICCRYCLCPEGQLVTGDGNQQQNQPAAMKRLLCCSECFRAFHAACLGLSEATVASIEKPSAGPWTCPSCTVCLVCGTADEDHSTANQLLYCDLCDRGTHCQCCDPPLDEPPPGGWRCSECVVCLSCGAKHPAGLNGGGGSASTWQADYTLCEPCAKAKQRSQVCSMCKQMSPVDAAATDPMIRCADCEQWSHARCEGIDEIELKFYSAPGADFLCFRCREDI